MNWAQFHQYRWLWKLLHRDQERPVEELLNFTSKGTPKDLLPVLPSQIYRLIWNVDQVNEVLETLLNTFDEYPVGPGYITERPGPFPDHQEPILQLHFDEIEYRCGLPLEKWPTECFYVCQRILEAGLCSGRIIEGHYLGYISDESASQYEWDTPAPHGWIETEDLLIDPTRWVFTGDTPQLYIAPLGVRDYQGENK